MKKLVSIHKLRIILLLIFFGNTMYAQESKTFSNLIEVFDYAKSINYGFENAKQQTQLAEIARKTALGNVFNPKISASIQAIDNITLPTSYLPAAAFGGTSGSFKELTMGLQYVTTFNIQPQFDIVNLANYAQIKSAKINQQLVENQNKLNEKSLYEKINAVYFNILSFKAQNEIIAENLEIANSILKILNNKFIEGIARKQEVNEAEVNVINLKDKLEQIEMNLKIQYQLLDLFFENKIQSTLAQSIWDYENVLPVSVFGNNLKNETIVLQTLLAQQEYKSLKYQNYPALSFVSSFNFQNLGNDKFFGSRNFNQKFNYVGLKIGWELPTIQRFSNLKNKQIQLQSLKINEEHTKKEIENENAQMVLEYEKSLKQKLNFQIIVDFKKDTYDKNFNQFKEGILPLDKLLISQTDMIISKLNVVSALANIGFNKNKIEILNKF